MCTIKKIFALLFAVTAVTLMNTAVFANVYTGEVKGCTYSFDDETGILTLYGKGNMSYWSSQPWMNERFSIRDVETAVISEGITTVGMYTFNNFTGLKTVVIPEGVTLIGESAFQNCKSLKEVVLPSTVDRIAVNAFRESGIEKINFPDKLRSIESTAFYNCTGLKSIELNNSLERVFSAFLSTGLTSVVIPKDVKSISDCAFGFYHSGWEDYPVDGFVIYGAAGSKAQEYAEKSNLTFVPLDVVTVDFDTAGKCRAPEQQATLSGTKISRVDEPYADGFIFVGWYYDNNFENKFEYGDKITKNETLYAKWDAVTAGEITFNDDGNVRNVYYGDDLVFNANYDDMQLRLAADYTDKDGTEHKNETLANSKTTPITVSFGNKKYSLVFSPDNTSINVKLQYFQAGPGFIDSHDVDINVVYKQGDINTDGSADDKDADILLKHISGTQRFYGEALTRANMNNDGKIDILDIIAILQHKKI
ncbi:MAG: leucine-rich repeat protein [Firmicutes bacterium]|nr:leucine-rich repeat protein [Bacillota bacterium]